MITKNKYPEFVKDEKVFWITATGTKELGRIVSVTGTAPFFAYSFKSDDGEYAGQRNASELERLEMTLDQFITQNGISFEYEQKSERPDKGTEWDKSATHWLVTLKKDGRNMSFYYSMGSAHTEPPKMEDVLDSVVSDSSCDLSSLNTFCEEFGYEEDSRKAEQIYLACVRQKQSLFVLLDSQDLVDTLLYHTERL